jgi:hypothetical protein
LLLVVLARRGVVQVDALVTPIELLTAALLLVVLAGAKLSTVV